MSEEDFDVVFKIVIVGDSGVGKTNLVSRYLQNEFKEDTKATVGVEFGEKRYTYNNQVIKAQIWDTAGQERYRSITSLYYKGSKGAIIVYDISSQSSFNNVDKWLSEMKKTTDPSISVILVGNKSDLTDKRVVTTEMGEEKAKDFGVPFMETSALNSDNVDKAFNTMIEDIASKVGTAKDEEEFEVISEQKNSVVLNTNEKAKEEEKCCLSS